MEQQEDIHPEQLWFEKGNVYNESEPFNRGKQSYVYRARLEEVEPGRFNVYLGEFKNGTWDFTEGRSTVTPVDIETVEKIFAALKLNKIGRFTAVDFREESTPEDKASDTKKGGDVKKDTPSPENKATETPKFNNQNPFNNKTPSQEKKATATPGEGNHKQPGNNPENRADKNKEADTNAMIFAKSAIRTAAIGASVIAGVALVAMFSPIVATVLGIGMGAKAIADSFLANANQALDEDKDILSYDTISSTISGALPVDVRSAIAVGYGIDPLTGEDLTPQTQAQMGGNIVGGAALAVAGAAVGAAAKLGQAGKANASRTFLDKNLSPKELAKRMDVLDKTKKWANTLPEKEKAVAQKIIAEHESGQLYGIKKSNGGVLILEKHSDTRPALDTLQRLFSNKSFGARNNKGRGYQGAHLNPATFMKQVKGYRRSDGSVVILPTKFRGPFDTMPKYSPDIHRKMDAIWKKFSIDLRAQGRTSITAQELLEVNIKAINSAPHLSPTAKLEMAAAALQEFIQYTKGDMSKVFKLSKNKGF